MPNPTLLDEEHHEPEVNFTVVPISLHNEIARHRISRSQVVLFLTISLLENPIRGCFASNNWLAERIGVSRIYIKKMLQQLKDKGFIHISKPGGGRSLRCIRTTLNRAMIDNVKTREHLEYLAGQLIHGPPVHLDTIVSHPGYKQIRKNAGKTPSVYPKSCIPRERGVKRKAARDLRYTGRHPLSSDQKPRKEKAKVSLFPNIPSLKSKLSPFDLACADKLRKHVVGTFDHVTAWNRKGWGQQFRRLRQSGEPPEEIERRLLWLFAHAKDPGVPRILGAKQFVRHYHHWLKDAMERDQRSNPTVAISDAAQAVVDKIETYHGGKLGDSKVLAAQVQTLLDRYTAFCDRLSQYVAKHTKYDKNTGKHTIRDKKIRCRVSDKHHAIAEMIDLAIYLGQVLTSGQELAFRWFEDIIERTHFNGSKWSGKFDKFVFDIKHPNFQKYGRQLVQNHCGDGSRWDKLMETLYEGEQER